MPTDGDWIVFFRPRPRHPGSASKPPAKADIRDARKRQRQARKSAR